MIHVIQTPKQLFYLAKLLGYSYGMLFVKGELFVSSTSPLKLTHLKEFHSPIIGGHSGIHRIFGRLKENMFWQGMSQDVVQFVEVWFICQ